MSSFVRCPPPGASVAELEEFALSYNAYRRLAGSPKRLLQVVRPVVRALDAGKPVPAWAELDLLRASLFYVHRRGHFAGPSPELGRAFRVLAGRIGDLAGGSLLPRDELS